MPTEIMEGRSGHAADQIDYPEINSCITITALKGNNLVGAHFVIPLGAAGKFSPAVVWGKLRNELRLFPVGVVSEVYVLGSLGTWRGFGYDWPGDFRRDIAVACGAAATCYTWDSQANTDETRIIRVSRGRAGVAVSYAKYSNGHVAGPWYPLARAAMATIGLAGGR